MNFNTFKLFILIFLLGAYSQIFAGQARVQALGGQDTTLYYFNDIRNVLINPAYLNLNTDLLIFEWGNDAAGGPTGNNDPRPEGGVFKSWGYFNFGIYLGNENGVKSREDVGVSSPPDFLYQDNSVELVVAGDAGVEWGGSVKFSSNMDEQTGVDREQSALSVRFGTLSGPLETFINVDLFDKSIGGASAKEEYRGKLGLLLGLSYLYQDFVFHGKFSKTGYEYYRASDGLKDITYDLTKINFGIGQGFYLDDKAKFYIDLSLDSETTTKKSALATSEVQSKPSYLKFPLVLGIESRVKEWLVLRGSIKQNLFSRVKNSSGKKKTESSSTQVNMGATLEFRKLKIEGLLGLTDTKGNFSKQGVLSLDNLLTRVALTYSF